MFATPKKQVSYYTTPLHNSDLSVTATFHCPLGCRCGEAQLYKEINLFAHRLLILNDDILQYQTISFFSLQENNI